MAGTTPSPSPAARPTSTPSTPPSTPAVGRPTPALVPQDVLAGQPEVPLNRPITTVGTAETNRLVLNSRTISRHHAIFLVDGPVTAVADLASRTGVLVNGRAVREVELNNGDRVQIGKFAFRYRSADPAVTAAAPVPPPAPAAAAVVAGLLAVPLAGRVALIGRRDTSDVALVGDNAASAVHAALFHVGGLWYARDLGSRTGTLVNGTAVIQQQVTFGDKVSVGSATIQFEPAGAVAPHAPVSVVAAAAAAAPPEYDAIPLPDELPAEPTPALAVPFEAAGAEPVVAEAIATPADRPVPDAVGPLDPTEPVDEVPETFGGISTGVDTAADAAVAESTPASTSPVAADEPAPADRPIPQTTDAADVVEPLGATPAAFDGASVVTDPAADGVPAEPTPVDRVPVADAEPVAPPESAFVDHAIAEPGHPAGVAEPTGATVESTIESTTVAGSPVADVALEPVPLADAAAGLPGTAEAVGEPWDQAAVATALPGPPVAADVLAPTDPDPGSALQWDAVVAAEADAEPAAAADDDLSDTQFARQVDDFTNTTTGPLVEPVESEPPASGEVSDFVFEPGASAATPDELYWGDGDELPAEGGASTGPLLPTSTVEPAEAATAASTASAAGVGLPDDAPRDPTEMAARPPALLPSADVAAATQDFAAEPEPVELSPAFVASSDDLTTSADVLAAAPDEPTEAFATAEQVDTDALDPALAVTPDTAAAEPPVAAVAYDDQLEESDTSAGEAAGGFEADAADDAPAADHDPVLPHVHDAPASPASPAVDGVGAVVNVADVLGAAVSSTAALTPVSDFAVVGGSAAVQSFAAVTDAALAEPPPAGPPAWPVTAETPAAETPAAETPAAETDPLGPEDDLAFLDFGDETPAPAEPVLADAAAPTASPQFVETVTEDQSAAVDPPAEGAVELPGEFTASANPTHPAEAAAEMTAAPPPSMSGPSLFGFNFDGGSFLGGMPLQLDGPDAPPRPASPAVPAPPLLPAADVAAEPRVRPATPPGGPPLSLTGMVQGTAAAAAASAVPPPPLPPIAPIGLVNGAARPQPAPVARPAVPPAPPVPLAGPNGRPRTAEVFSQMAGPIGVEAFATRPRSADQYHIPEVDRSAPAGANGNGAGYATAAAARPDAVPPPVSAAYQAAVEAQLMSAKVRRGRKVRVLAAAALLAPAAWAALVALEVPKDVVIVGSLAYDGLDHRDVSETDRRQFEGAQANRLYGEDVRQMARASLKADNRPGGLTDDPLDQVARRQSAHKLHDFVHDNTLQLTYEAADRDAGVAQVRAVLSALRAKDADLDDARARAQHDLDVARRAADEARAKDDDVRRRRREETAVAQDRPDKPTLDAMDRAAKEAAQRVADVADDRAAVEADLAALERRDPSLPVDPETDPAVVDVRRRRDQLDAQLKQAEGVSAQADNPIVGMMRSRRDALQAELDRRQAELTRAALVPPDQRRRDRDAAIEAKRLRVTSLVRSGEEATVAAKAAADVAAAAHAKDAVARAASGRVDDLISQQYDADQALQAASSDLADKQRAVNASVTVAATPLNPVVTVAADSDPRLMVAVLGGLVLFLLFGLWALATAGGLAAVGGDDDGSPPAGGEPAETVAVDAEHHQLTAV